MAQELVTSEGTTAIPGAYASATIENDVSNTAVRGVLTLVGEADAGPGWEDEPDLKLNYFTPDQFASIRSKYRSGRIVEAAYAATQPSQDPKLLGAPQLIRVVKTNRSTKASLPILDQASAAYATLADKSWGEYGNLISVAITDTASEVIPTTSAFTLLVPNNSTDIALRTNGGASLPLTLAALALPPTVVTALDGLTGIAASGGANRGIVTVAGSLTVVAAGNSITVTRTVAWAVTPVIGDTLYIPSGSVIQGATNKNRGSYVITQVTPTTLTATKLLDDAGGAGSLTAPESVAIVLIAAITDIQAFSPVTITQEAADPIHGYGKSLEIAELTSATGRLSDLAYQLNTTKVSWLSKTATPYLLTSVTERSITLSDQRAVDSIVEENTSIGGTVVLALGYIGNTGTCTITSTALTTTVAGGSGVSLNLAHKKFVTISDLVTYINSQSGYTCTLLEPQYGSRPPTELDRVSAVGICSTFTVAPGRIKRDAQSFYDTVYSTQLLQLGTALPVTATTANPRPSGADRGLPATLINTYLSGGTKASTTEAQFAAAIDACEKLITNFGCALISRDASADIIDGETESGSTYTLAAVTTRIRKQAETLSQKLRRRNRQWFIGVSGSYTAYQRPFAINQSTVGRLVIAMQNVYANSADGGIVGFAPWYTAVLAAAMQLAAYRKGILHREPTQNGVYHAYGDFDPATQAQDALRSGLLVLSQGEPNPLVPGSSGRWTFTSDQTAYVRNSNFYYNSIQAVFVLDQVLLSVSRGVEDAVVGESSADVDATMVKSVTESYLALALSAGLIAVDDEALKGYSKVVVTQTGGTFKVRVFKLKLAGLIYFVDMEFDVSQIKRTA